MNATILLLISLVTTITLAAWRSGLIQSAVNRASLKLPRWAQPIPPLVLASVAVALTWTVYGGAPESFSVEDGATMGLGALASIGIYHFTKRLPGELIKAILAGIAAAPKATDAAKKTGKVGLVLLVFFVGGCAGTLEEARGTRLANVKVLGLPVTATARDESRCEVLSERSYWFGGFAKGTAAVASGAAVSTWPIRKAENEEVAALVAGGAGVLAVALTYFSDEATAAWVEEGCGG